MISSERLYLKLSVTSQALFLDGLCLPNSSSVRLLAGWLRSPSPRAPVRCIYDIFRKGTTLRSPPSSLKPYAATPSPTPAYLRVSLVKPPPRKRGLDLQRVAGSDNKTQLTANRLVTLSRYHDASSPAGPGQQKRSFLPIRWELPPPTHRVGYLTGILPPGADWKQRREWRKAGYCIDRGRAGGGAPHTNLAVGKKRAS